MNHVLVKAEGIAGSMVCSGDVRERSCLSRMYVKASKGSPEKPTYLICSFRMLCSDLQAQQKAI